MEGGREAEEVGRRGGGSAGFEVEAEFGFRGDGVLTPKLVDRERGIWPGRSSESDDGLRVDWVG